MATLREQIATNVLTVPRFRELMRKLRENRPNDDLNLVKRAYEFSQKHHAGQHRASGQPYGVHPDRKSTRLNSSHLVISYAVFCLKKIMVGRALAAGVVAWPNRSSSSGAQRLRDRASRLALFFF